MALACRVAVRHGANADMAGAGVTANDLALAAIADR
jgi:hypothetical protein